MAIGNERVSTVHGNGTSRPGLIGMDFVRLGLERARTAQEALEILIGLLTTYGQGGIADAEHNEAYDSSFLIADTTEAFVLDTSGTEYAAAPVAGATAISNRLTVGSRWTQASPALARRRLRPLPRSRCAHSVGGPAPGRRTGLPRGPNGLPVGGSPPLQWRRTSATTAAVRGVHPKPRTGAAAAGRRGWGERLHACAAAERHRGLVHRGPPGGAGRGAPLRASVALGSPCTSIYVPAFPRTAAGPPPYVPFELSGEPMWRAADALRQRVDADPAAIEEIRDVLDPVEEELWAEADDVADRPQDWSAVASSWGAPALRALLSCAVDRPSPTRPYL